MNKIKKISIFFVLILVIIASYSIYNYIKTQPPKGLKGKIVFEGTIPTFKGDKSAIGIYDLEKGKEIILTTEKTVFEPKLSPNGTDAIYCLFEDENIYLNNINTSNKRILLESNGKYGYSLPSWSPDGNNIVFNRFSLKKNVVPIEEQGIYLMNLKDNKLTKLIDKSDYETGAPVFYPNGQEITFMGKHPGEEKYKVYSVNINTKEIKLISEIAKSLTWSPDGTKLCYISSDDNSMHIVNADGTNDVVIKKLKSYGWSCAWSPDGTKIIFDYIPPPFAQTPRQIYIINTDGTGLQRFYPKGKWTSISSPQWWTPKE